MKTNRFWLCIFGGVVIVCLAAMLVVRRSPANQALIYQNGELIERLELAVISEEYIFTIENEAGRNVIAVENGGIRIIDADCPDGSCIHQGWINSGSMVIVCLPHKLVIKLDAAAGPQVDAIAR